MGIFCDYDVFTEGYAKKLSYFFELLRYRIIFFGRFCISAGVIVSDNDTRSPVFYRLSKDFARMD